MRKQPAWRCAARRAIAPPTRACARARALLSCGRLWSQELLLWLDANSDSHGAVLVFLPGMGEIQTLYESLAGRREFARDGRFWVLPLHSSLSSQEQVRAACARACCPRAARMQQAADSARVQARLLHSLSLIHI